MITVVCKKCNAVIVDKPYGSCLTVTEGGYCDKCLADLEAKLAARDADPFGVYVGGVRVGEIPKPDSGSTHKQLIYRCLIKAHECKWSLANGRGVGQDWCLPGSLCPHNPDKKEDKG